MKGSCRPEDWRIWGQHFSSEICTDCSLCTTCQIKFFFHEFDETLQEDVKLFDERNLSLSAVGCLPVPIDLIDVVPDLIHQTPEMQRLPVRERGCLLVPNEFKKLMLRGFEKLGESSIEEREITECCLSVWSWDSGQDEWRKGYLQQWSH